MQAVPAPMKGMMRTLSTIMQTPRVESQEEKQTHLNIRNELNDFHAKLHTDTHCIRWNIDWLWLQLSSIVRQASEKANDLQMKSPVLPDQSDFQRLLVA